MSIPKWWGTPADELHGVPIDQLQGLTMYRKSLESFLGKEPSLSHALQLFRQDGQEDSLNPAYRNPPTLSCSSVQTTFCRFRHLSIEIRAMIWNHALPGSRVVDLIYDENQDRYLSFNSSPPALLHACSESRRIASKVYNLCFATQSHTANIYFRYDRDILYFVDWLSCCKYYSNGWFEHVTIGPLGKKGVGREEQHSITQVAINSCFMDIARSCYPGNELWYLHRSVFPILTRLKALERIFIVLEDIDPYDRQEISFFNIPNNSVFAVFLRMSHFPEAEDIEHEMTKDLSGTPNEHDAPKVVMVGSARGNKLSHTGTFPFCQCKGENFDHSSSQHDFNSCNDYEPEISEIMQMTGLMSAQIDDDSDEQASETSEEMVSDSIEMEDLIRDEENYLYFVENNCGEKYGTKHEEWIGLNYLAHSHNPA